MAALEHLMPDARRRMHDAPHPVLLSLGSVWRIPEDRFNVRGFVRENLGVVSESSHTVSALIGCCA